MKLLEFKIISRKIKFEKFLKEFNKQPRWVSGERILSQIWMNLLI